MNMTGKNGYFVDLFDIFPRTASGVWHPFVTVAPLGSPLNGQVVVHEQQVIHFWMFPYLWVKSNLQEVKFKGMLPPLSENISLQVVYIHRILYSSKSKIIEFAVMWLELEDIILSEVRRKGIDPERSLYMWDLKIHKGQKAI